MSDIIRTSLYKKQNIRFEKINTQSKAFAVNYCPNMIIRDAIVEIITNYARKQDKSLEVLRYPFKDDELWAFTFIKKGTLFLCVNTDLPLCKQIFAMAHELYHIQCYAEDIDTSTIAGGSLLDSRIADEQITNQEDLEANAFAGLLLMPDSNVIEHFNLFGLSKKNLNVDGVLTLMDIFALPFKAVVLRLVEARVIEEDKARELLSVSSDMIIERINLTGKAAKWQKNGNDLIHYGSLLENLTFNSKHELLMNTREESDIAYLDKIGKEFRKEM